MLNKAEKYIALSAACMLMFSACSSDDALSIPDNQGKTPIELTVGTSEQLQAITRAGETPMPVVTSDKGSVEAFNAGTSLYMVMKSENSGDQSATAMFSRTIGYAQGYASSAQQSTKVTFSSLYGRFWEDSYSRNSQLSVFAACVPGYYWAPSIHEELQGEKSGTEDKTIWSLGNLDGAWDDTQLTTYDNKWLDSYGYTSIAWPLRGQSVAQQDVAFVSAQDLCFSNNISALSTTDHRVTFDASSKRFGSGQMVFWHALSRVTFQVKKGKGFEKDEKFEFSEPGKNIVLKKFFTNGTFNIEQGQFTASAVADIDQLAITSTNENGFDYTLDGLMLPGTDLNDQEEGTISFTINNNLYLLKKSVLMQALSNKTLSDNTDALDNGKMRPGVHYVFTMTVGKKQMDSFTASVMDWETVTADEVEPTNARILISFLQGGDPVADPSNLDLFRSANVDPVAGIHDDFESFDWQTGYTSKAQLVQRTQANNGVYEAKEGESDPWYWPDNKTFYHFRTVMPKTTDAWKVETTDGNDYITLTAADDYTDVCWGAPFTTTTQPTYDYTTHGYDGTASHQISKAVGPLDTDHPESGPITIVMFHMMSDVVINLTTTDGSDKVDLSDAKLELSQIYPTGKVLMGNGLVMPTGTPGTVTDITVGNHYGFVPQALDDVVLTITTKDNNQYIIDMKDVKSGSDIIDRWLPNHKYTYTFKLTKAGITKMTATLMKWQQVEAGDDNVQIR